MNQFAKIQQPINTGEIVKFSQSDFLAVSVDNRIKWEAEFQFALQILKKNKKLDSVAWNNQDSLRDAIINVSAIGISLNPASQHAFLIPRKNVVCLDVSYRGLIHLAVSSGSIEWGQAKLVHQKDSYKNNGVSQAPTHDYNAFSKDRGAVIGAYCVANTKSNDYLVEEMSLEDLLKIRDCSEAFKAGHGPWIEWEQEMMKKTVIKRASKVWPKAQRLDTAIQHLNEVNDEGINFDDPKTIAKLNGKPGTWRRGRNPNNLDPALKPVYGELREAFETGDVDMFSKLMFSFDIYEEKEAVWRCFASDERRAVGNWDTDHIDEDKLRKKTKRVSYIDPEPTLKQKVLSFFGG